MKATGPSQSPLLLLDVIETLDRLGVSYAVVGALAAAYHGVVRASRDADAVISAPSSEIPALVEALQKAGLQVHLSPSAADDPIRQVLGVLDNYDNRVDQIGRAHV